MVAAGGSLARMAPMFGVTEYPRGDLRLTSFRPGNCERVSWQRSLCCPITSTTCFWRAAHLALRTARSKSKEPPRSCPPAHPILHQHRLSTKNIDQKCQASCCHQEAGLQDDVVKLPLLLAACRNQLGNSCRRWNRGKRCHFACCLAVLLMTMSSSSSSHHSVQTFQRLPDGRHFYSDVFKPNMHRRTTPQNGMRET